MNCSGVIKSSPNVIKLKLNVDFTRSSNKKDSVFSKECYSD